MRTYSLEILQSPPLYYEGSLPAYNGIVQLRSNPATPLADQVVVTPRSFKRLRVTLKASAVGTGDCLLELKFPGANIPLNQANQVGVLFSPQEFNSNKIASKIVSVPTVPYKVDYIVPFISQGGTGNRMQDPVVTLFLETDELL
jgi:hypothetical protein